MRAIAWLLCLSTSITAVNANVEKTIFLGPGAETITNVRSSLDDLRLDTLEPAELPILATQLPVAFPTHRAPRGLESWYILRGLQQGQRYEVRICWPAFQPTDFRLDAFAIADVFNTPSLISSLARYSGQRQTSPLQKSGYTADISSTAHSILFLRIQAAASYHSPNKTLISNPPPVDVDIILDPFILNVLPASLGPTAIYITVVALAAWFVSGYIYRWVLAVSDEFEDKNHKE